MPPSGSVRPPSPWCVAISPNDARPDRTTDGEGGAMSERGARTRARLIQATTDVVGQVGYARATTRAIADAAGVAEGTIYRHFPDKQHLFFAAVLERNAPVIDWVSQFPARAGQASVRENLRDALVQLGRLRADLLPLELSLRADPDLARNLYQ